MDTAYCTIDGKNYDAHTFSRLHADELDRKRQALLCTECRERAYFRKGSRSGSGPCFGANPHAPHCLLGRAEAIEHPGKGVEIRSERFNPGDRIVLDDAHKDEGEHHATPDAATPKASVPRYRGTADGQGARRSTSTRRLRPILRELVSSPALQRSTIEIKYHNFPSLPAHEFFVPLRDANGATHQGMLRGYWGVIVSARLHNGTLYLNTGGPGDVSVALRKYAVAFFLEANGIEDVEDLAGMWMLALGEFRVSTTGKQLVHVSKSASLVVQWVD